MCRGRNIHILAASWLLVMVVLSAFPILRVGDVQLLEVLQSLRLGISMVVLIGCGLKIPTNAIWRQYGYWYGLFLIMCAALSIVSLRLTFYPVPDVSALKQPLTVSIARLFELGLVMYFTVACADTLASKPRLIRYALDTYYSIGTLSALVSIASFIALTFSGVQAFSAYGADKRVRGFFNEGGPYGLFLVSAILVGFIRAHYFRPRRAYLHRAALFPLFLALALSGSKAGALAGAVLCVIGVATSTRTRQRRLMAGSLVISIGLFIGLFRDRFVSYLFIYSNFEALVPLHEDDPSMMMGRLVAVFIVPRMILAHPALGIGLGNYSLMRNDPEYLDDLPPTNGWDLPGLGLLGSAAELGVPLTLFLLFLLLKPMAHARRAKSPGILVIAAGFQPVAVLLGVNLNFFYPWLVTAFALSLLFLQGGRNAPELGRARSIAPPTSPLGPYLPKVNETI